MPNEPIVIVHGWSDDKRSFQRLKEFLHAELSRDVEEIHLADWVSMDDDVTFQDLRYAMNLAWSEVGLPRTARSVDVVTHSTGAVVARDWMTEYFLPDEAPLHRHLMLAPANYGSPIAHKGRAFLGRVLKGWRTQFETGTHLLKGLELASPYTWALAERDILRADGSSYYGAGRVLATVLVGNRGYDGVAAAANEPGGDGTVRVSTANLNAIGLSLFILRITSP